MNLVDVDTKLLYDSLPRVVMGHQHVESGGGRWLVRTETPWEPRHGDSYELKGWDALRPPKRPWIWVLLHPRSVWRESTAWRRLVKHDQLERKRLRQEAEQEARRLAVQDFQAKFSKQG